MSANNIKILSINVIVSDSFAYNRPEKEAQTMGTTAYYKLLFTCKHI